MVNVHQQGNGIDLVVRRPLPGSGDICFHWDGTIAQAQDRHTVWDLTASRT